MVCDTGAVPASTSGSQDCAGVWHVTTDGRKYIVRWHWVCESQSTQIPEDT